VYQIVYAEAMRTLLGLVFVAAVAAGAAYVFERPTVARGEVFAAQFMSNSPLFAKVECDDEIPIGVDGAKFRCRFTAKDGDRAELELTMDRAGQFTNKVVTSTEPAHDHSPSADPWD
jgi:hypothetical protein